jgi:hypothetical protein
MVPPIVTATASSVTRFIRYTMGKPSRVCEAISEPISTAANQP